MHRNLSSWHLLHQWQTRMKYMLKYAQEFVFMTLAASVTDQDEIYTTANLFRFWFNIFRKRMKLLTEPKPPDVMLADNVAADWSSQGIAVMVRRVALSSGWDDAQLILQLLKKSHLQTVHRLTFCYKLTTFQFWGHGDFPSVTKFCTCTYKLATFSLKSWGMVMYHQSLSSELVHYKLATYVAIKILGYGDVSPITQFCTSTLQTGNPCIH